VCHGRILLEDLIVNRLGGAWSSIHLSAASTSSTCANAVYGRKGENKLECPQPEKSKNVGKPSVVKKGGKVVKKEDLENEAKRRAQKEKEQQERSAPKAKIEVEDDEPEPEACAACGKFVADAEGGKMAFCAGCRQVQYCSKNCQKKHWEWTHRETCPGRAHVEEKIDLKARQEANEEREKNKEAWDAAQAEKKAAQEAANEKIKRERTREMESSVDDLEALSAWIMSIGIKGKDVDKYTAALSEEGLKYDSFHQIAALSHEKLKEMGVKKGHMDIILVEAREAAKSVPAPPAPPPPPPPMMSSEGPDVDTMSVKELKSFIKSKGLSSADCCEKKDLQARAREALERPMK